MPKYAMFKPVLRLMETDFKLKRVFTPLEASDDDFVNQITEEYQDEAPYPLALTITVGESKALYLSVENETSESAE